MSIDAQEAYTLCYVAYWLQYIDSKKLEALIAIGARLKRTISRSRYTAMVLDYILQGVKYTVKPIRPVDKFFKVLIVNIKAFHCTCVW